MGKKDGKDGNVRMSLQTLRVLEVFLEVRHNKVLIMIRTWLLNKLQRL